MAPHIPSPRTDPPPPRRLVAPPYLPTPKPLPTDLTQPGNPLVPDKPGSDRCAATALFCWTQAARTVADQGWPIPYDLVRDACSLHLDSPLPRAAEILFQLSPQRAGLLWIYPDGSVLLADASLVDAPKGRRLDLLRPFPVPMRVAPSLAVAGGPTTIAGWDAATNGRPVATVGKKRVAVDPDSPSAHGKLLWAALVRGAKHWLDAQRPQARSHQPPGPDWGQSPDGPWIVPPHLPHAAVLPERIEAVRLHLQQAAVLIDAAFDSEAIDWAGYVRARARTLKGTLAPADIGIQALSAATGQRDKQLEQRIASAWIKALRHPACPVTYTDLQSTTAYNPPKKGKQHRILCLPTLLWNGRKQTHSAHARLQALAALGGNAWLS